MICKLIILKSELAADEKEIAEEMEFLTEQHAHMVAKLLKIKKNCYIIEYK